MGTIIPFDRFEDIKPIGEGGFAKVYYKCYDVSVLKKNRKII